jgi:hypothetical protein
LIEMNLCHGKKSEDLDYDLFSFFIKVLLWVSLSIQFHRAQILPYTITVVTIPLYYLCFGSCYHAMSATITHNLVTTLAAGVRWLETLR